MAELNQVYCPIRKTWVANLPEEMVRQKLINELVYELGFPASGLVLEKSLAQMPHLSLTKQKLPTRRADIVFFGKGIHPNFDLYPLLLIECKAVNLSSKVLNQVMGYNHFLQSYFILVVNQYNRRLGWFCKKKKEYEFIDYLPNFHQLMQTIQPVSNNILKSVISADNP